MTLKQAVKDGRLNSNPADGVNFPSLEQTEQRFLTDDQVWQLAEDCGPEYRVMVLSLAYTGIRWGEMAALRVGRPNFLTRRALIAESVSPVRGVMTFGPTKNHLKRKVPIPPSIIEELAAHVAGKAKSDLVFQGERGGVLRSQTFQRAIFTKASAAMLTEDGEDEKGLHPHELRHGGQPGHRLRSRDQGGPADARAQDGDD